MEPFPRRTTFSKVTCIVFRGCHGKICMISDYSLSSMPGKVIKYDHGQP